MRKMYKVGDTVARTLSGNTAIGSPIGTHGRITRIDKSDNTYRVLLLDGLWKGKEVWWFHQFTELVNNKPNWEV